jgi:very-short-patch-repair endonuclease
MLKNIAPKARGGGVPRARKLRAEMSLPEVVLWRALRERPHGLKFRRQHASGPFILDFFCSDARLAIEIDSDAHSRGDRPERDAARDVYFLKAGIKTLRIAARDVLRDVGAAVMFIIAEAKARLPLHHPAAPAGPPPRDKLGED